MNGIRFRSGTLKSWTKQGKLTLRQRELLDQALGAAQLKRCTLEFSSAQLEYIAQHIVKPLITVGKSLDGTLEPHEVV